MYFNKDVTRFVAEIEEALKPAYEKIEALVFANQNKVLSAFKRNRLSERHFNETTGYGYSDDGREITDKIYADVLDAQAALVRTQFFSGTHAITTALFGVLRPGDNFISITNAPYATVKTAVLSDQVSGTLKEFGIGYKQVDLRPDGSIDYDKVFAMIDRQTKLIYLQRSTGYDDRKAIGISEIAETVEKIKQYDENLLVFVDNCYGEFLEEVEPTGVGVDFMAGSLIKNIGGGLAKTGAYIAGREEIVDMCAQRINAPGIGAESGSNLGQVRTILQGLFLAPKVTGEALKNAMLVGCCFDKLGYRVYPTPLDKRSDIIQAIVLKDKQQVLTFCKAVQEISPVDSYVTPEARGMPGYDSNVIMAAGCFIQGSSIEMSADSPMKEPYTVYFQGGLTHEHGKLAAMHLLQEMKLLSH